MKQDTTLTHIDYAAIERAASRLRQQEIRRIAGLIASTTRRAAVRVTRWIGQRVSGKRVKQVLNTR